MAIVLAVVCQRLPRTLCTSETSLWVNLNNRVNYRFTMPSWECILY